MGPDILFFGSLDPYITYPYIYPPITPLKGPYYLGPWTLRVSLQKFQTKPLAAKEPRQAVEPAAAGLGFTTMMENQMEKKMENEMETRKYVGIIRV